MNNLIDTHALIWFLNGDNDLSDKAKKAIEDKDAINFISIASLWGNRNKNKFRVSLSLRLHLTKFQNKLIIMVFKFCQ